MPNEVPRLVVDDHELQHHSTLRYQRSSEVHNAATPPHEHLNSLSDELGVAGSVGVEALREYHANFRHTELKGIAAAHGAIGANLRGHAAPAFDGADVDNGRRVAATDEFDR
ncbi:hypothetical protein K7711_36700 [Nocardia sp. CA2R105]|uniref:type VII secretion target n=1 Tax=Nocardia coffeae TaxID=2873381 RepID=UPI001CA75DF7|nr:type VII secretion target [Nocardia coffeae]MBY8862065.1 hypothetical protein [Nocardia coffeae]